MDPAEAMDVLISEIDNSLDRLKAAPSEERTLCEPHRQATIVLLKCQRASLMRARDANTEARKAGGIVAAIVAAVAAALQYLLNK
jgi:hypothetical protein